MRKIQLIRRIKYALEGLLIAASLALFLHLSAQENRATASNETPIKGGTNIIAILPNKNAPSDGSERRMAGK